jgi:amidase
MDRRDFVASGTVAAVVASQLGGCRAEAPPATPKAVFDLEEATIAQLQENMASGLTSAMITQQYLDRIAAIDHSGPSVNSVIEVNPEALADAARLDAERQAGKSRGPLHGVPILIKDNIDTGDRMRTSAGSLALADMPAPRDAYVVERLRAGGAVILGKTNCSEWANFRSSHSTSGWSGRGGQTRNPYALDRNPCGSSSGTGAAISANLAMVGVGTETDGSVVCPATANGLVGLKPTVGLLSRSGIIPISASQDTAGPMTRTVRDTAILLNAMIGVDPADHTTAMIPDGGAADFTTFLSSGGLSGARLGVLRRYFGGLPALDQLMEDSLTALRDAGAVIVDPVEIVTVPKLGAPEFEVLLYEFKDGLNRYLAGRGDSTKYHTLAELIEFNKANAAKEMPWFGQETFELAQKKGPLTEAAYRRALAECRRLARAEGIDATLRRFRLDAMVCPTGGPAWVTDLVNGDHFGSAGDSSTPAAVAGYPHITVPAGFIDGLPVGLSFMGPAWSEGRLLRYAFAFEQATTARRAPEFRATIG